MQPTPCIRAHTVANNDYPKIFLYQNLKIINLALGHSGLDRDISETHQLCFASVRGLPPVPYKKYAIDYRDSE